MQAFIAFFKSLGAARIVAMGAVTIALAAFFAFLIMRVTAPQMTALFTDLSVEDSSAIIKDLERQGIPYEMRNEGAILMVPKERVTRLRMKLAESGLPKGGGVGYEIFDKSDALGATSFIQNINHLRALEGELARTIRALDRVQSARVHLVLPERPLFSRDKADPSASIVLKVRGTLDPTQVRAIRHLVASAVNGLKPQRVSVVDETGRLLADGSADQTPGGVTADERKIAFETRLRNQVESIVTSVVGPGRARVQLTADFDFNRITQTSDRYDPESRVVRSSQTREEVMAAAENRDGTVTVASQLPGAQQQQQGDQQQQQQQRDQNRKSEEIVNYEISRTTKTEVTEGGRINRISVAVVVDGNYTKNDRGDLVYEPRNKEEIDRIAALVRTAIGFDQYGAKIWALLDDDDLRQLSIVMSTLGTVSSDLVENLLLEFVSKLSASGALMGNYDHTERLLQQYLPPERVGGIMDEIRGPAGRNMWEKLSNVQEEVLANYLKNEYPQTVAVVLSKLRPEHAARVLSILPEELSLDFVNRMLKMEAVQKEVLERVEQTLRTEFMSSISQTRRRDAHEVMAEIFNNFDRQTETRFLTALEEENRESAERIKNLMFTFDDLVKLDGGSAQTLMRHIDKDKLGVALKGASEPVRQFFLGNMSTRAAKMLVDDMQAMGPVRLRDVDEAQVLLVNLAKDLAAKGEIIISKQRGDEELIY